MVSDDVNEGKDLIVDSRDSVRDSGPYAFQLGKGAVNVQCDVSMERPYYVDRVACLLEEYRVLGEGVCYHWYMVVHLPISVVGGDCSGR